MSENEHFQSHFGYGDKIVTVGTADDRPAVFVCPTDEPGTPGEDAPVEDGLSPGEWFMTFPTESQARSVCAALQGLSRKQFEQRVAKRAPKDGETR